MSKCRACDREANEKGGYCELHMKAYANVMRKYEDWKRARNIEWEEYLEQIRDNPFTGESAKKVAQLLIEEKRKHT